MTDAEISRRLALAIGWDVLPLEDGDEVATVIDRVSSVDRYFDYRDPAVIWPVAERFDCFPYKVDKKYGWGVNVFSEKDGWKYIEADTAAKAVALAVIAAHGG